MRFPLLPFFLVLCASLLLGGCTQPGVSHSARTPMSKESIIGQWVSEPPLLRNASYHEYLDIRIAQFNRDQTGVISSASVGRDWASAYYQDFTWKQISPDTFVLEVSAPKSLYDHKGFAWWAKDSGTVRAYSTPAGLMIDGVALEIAYFNRSTTDLGDPLRYAANAAKDGQRSAPVEPNQNNMAMMQSMLGAVQSGYAAGGGNVSGSYASTGSNYAAQQAVATVTQEVMVAALTDSPEEAQAARQSFQTSYAIGSGNTQAVAQSLAPGGAGLGGAAQAGGSNAAQSAAAAQMAEAIASGNDFVTTVAVQDARQHGYSDGYAYNIQTVLPSPGYHNAGGSKTAGEFCIFYGLPLEQARSLLATGFALSGDRSAYGPGNPQQTVSWERVSVRNGGSVKMGVQWQSGTMPAAPRFANRYINSKP